MAGLDDLYREVILDHYRNPRNRGELPPPAVRIEGFNPLCGDQVILSLEVTDGVVSNLKLSGHGCSISQSSASMMSQAVKGNTVERARELIHAFKAMMSIHEKRLDDLDGGGDIEPGRHLGDLEALQGVVKFPVRIKCATLSWNTLQEGLDTAAATTHSPTETKSVGETAQR